MIINPDPLISVDMHPATNVTVRIVATEARVVVKLGDRRAETNLFLNRDELVHLLAALSEAHDDLCAERAEQWYSANIGGA